MGTIAEAVPPMPCFSVRFIANFEDYGGHTVYEIRVTAPNGAFWSIRKRYSEIRELHDTLRVWLSDRLPPIPGRRLFGNQLPAFIAERQAGLERCLNGTLQLVTSQMPSLLGFVSSFLGVTEQTGRGRSLAALHRRDSSTDQHLHMETSVPAHSATPAARCRHFEGCISAPHPRAASVDGTTTACSQWHMRGAGVQGTPARQTSCSLTRSMTPSRPEIPTSFTSNSSEHRSRRWSRRHHHPAASQAASGSFVADAPSVADAAKHAVVHEVPMVAADVPVSTELQVSAQPQNLTNKVNNALASAEIPPGSVAQLTMPIPSSLLSAAPNGNYWDWPLSRPEKMERLRLVDREVANLDQSLLMGELEQLRSARGNSRSDVACELPTPSKRPSV